MTVQFVKLSADNCQAAFELQLSCHAYPWSRDVFESCLDGQYFAYQLEQDKQIVGYYVGLKVLDEATLMDIGINAGERGKGLGESLLRHFLAYCDEHAMAEIWLEVRQSNTPAIRLYQKSGFELIESRKGYYETSDGREDALIMKLYIIK